MNFYYLKPIIYFIPLVIIQLVLIPLISVMNITPNLIFILLSLFTLRLGQAYGTILGFVLGFLFDIISGGIIGASMLSFTVSVFVVGYFYNENKINDNTKSYFFVFIVFLCATINSIIYSAVVNSNPSISLLFLIFEAGILPGIYTAIFSISVVLFKPKEEM